ncbi:MAG: DUF1232 domain-containing protein [Paludibacteraceae bacterium]|nr:DUF1232 domain-containing protein [Paludibacteraceae bacterium]
MEKRTKYKWNIGIGLVVMLLYVILPTDVMPDVVPVMGWIDDAVAVLLGIGNAIMWAKKLSKKE